MRPRQTEPAARPPAKEHEGVRRGGLVLALHDCLLRDAYTVPSEAVAASIIARALERRAGGTPH